MTSIQCAALKEMKCNEIHNMIIIKCKQTNKQKILSGTNDTQQHNISKRPFAQKS